MLACQRSERLGIASDALTGSSVHAAHTGEEMHPCDNRSTR